MDLVVVLMLMSNQLKQLAKDYNLFIFSATQVNATGMEDNGEFKNETSIRAAKSIVDKADMAYVMSKVSEKQWNSIIPKLKQAAREGALDISMLNRLPTHVLDIYKMRRGQYKNVRIWTYIDLGNGNRRDLFMTTADNQPISEPFDIYNSALEIPIDNWQKEVIHD